MDHADYFNITRFALRFLKSNIDDPEVAEALKQATGISVDNWDVAGIIDDITEEMGQYT